MNISMQDISEPLQIATERYNDRDLSWLSFNKRVLDETGFADLKVYDKIKFIAIHGSNLDEFARVRLATLEQIAAESEEDKKAFYEELLTKVRHEVHHQSIASREILEEIIFPELESNDIILYHDTESLPQVHYEEVMHIFMSKVLSYLQPVIITPKTKIFLEDRMLYFLVHLNAGHRLEDLKIILNIPNFALPRFYSLSKLNGKHYIIFLDDIIRIGSKKLFREFIFNGFFAMKLNRNADLHLEDKNEDREDLIEDLQRGFDYRRTGEPSRFQYDADIPEPLVQFCRERFSLVAGEMLPVARYLSTNDFFRFPNPVGTSLMQLSWPPLKHPLLLLYGNYFEAISQCDYILHFPYQTYDYVLVFFNLAVLDQNVTEIMATFYRVAQDSHIVNALISAAKNGKKVKAFVELKARFDEANNLYWAEQMSKAGVEITYSIPGIKVHAKAALIKRREYGAEKKYAFFGTGNFNEKTAGIYSDMGLLTANAVLCDELEKVFQYLYKRQQPQPFQHLLVGQFGSLERFIALIDNEICLAQQGRKCGITIKVNNLEDEELIDKLYKASQAGVPVKMIVRSICRLKPGIKGLSENITLYRVVGRYLEHSRIFHFVNDGKNDVYLGSADWMRRNLRNRVEVVFPITDKRIKKEVLSFLRIQLTPARKTQLLSENLETLPWPEKPKQHCAQRAFYLYLKKINHKNG
jgi:polyphosphate kinase